MSRLRNRIVKADFWTDAELLRWPRDKRETYRGLWAIAEDSACLEDDPFGWKLLLWPSPMDADITVELLAPWRDELVATGKIIPYTAEGKTYLYIKNFHQHEKPRNPQPPDLPLPPWVLWQTTTVERKDSGRGRQYSTNSYVVLTDLLPQPYDNTTETVPLSYDNPNETPVRSCPVLSGPVQSLKPLLSSSDGADSGSSDDSSSPDALAEDESDDSSSMKITRNAPKKQQHAEDVKRFPEFWQRYPRKVAVAKAREKWGVAVGKDTPAAILAGLELQRPEMLARIAAKETNWVPHAATWLHNERWKDEVPKQLSALEMIDAEWGGEDE